MLDRVSSVVSECLGHSITKDLAFLDMILLSLIRSSSYDIGRLLDAIVVTGEMKIRMSYQD